MEYCTTKEAGVKWHITKRRVQILCAQKRIIGAIRIANLWLIPTSAQKPEDLRCGLRRSPSYDK